jgi:hypothetical protein
MTKQKSMLGELIHYGTTQYRPELVVVQNIPDWNKPWGGFWTSPVDSAHGWADWCRGANTRKCKAANSVRVRLHENARLLIIDTDEDIKALPIQTKHQLREHIPEDFRHIFPIGLDFEALARDYDAIWVTVAGLGRSRHHGQLTLQMWDCETVLILNPGACYQVSLA